jgi:hypothetical protein
MDAQKTLFRTTAMVGLLVAAGAGFVALRAEPGGEPGRQTTGRPATGGAATRSVTGPPSASVPVPAPRRGTPPVPVPATASQFRAPIYVMPSQFSEAELDAAMTATGARHFNLAFVLDSGGCVPAWDGDADHTVAADTAVASMIRMVRARGGDVAVSLGGYNGVELGASCGSATRLADAYQQVIDRYRLTRLDLDYEGDDLGGNIGTRMRALRILQDRARGDGRELRLTLTVPVTTAGLDRAALAQVKAGLAAGVRFELINLMAFDFGPTGEWSLVDTVRALADRAKDQLKKIFGYDDATAYARLGLQLMNGRTDVPTVRFRQSDFQALLGYARSKHLGWFSYWSLNRDKPCDPAVTPGPVSGFCSGVPQTPYDFSKIVAQYGG